MGELARNYVPALLAWGMLLWLRPGPAPGRRLVRLCVLGLAVSQTALTPAATTLARAASSHGVERLVGHVAMLAAVWAGAQILLRLHGYEARARAHTAWVVFAGVVMCLLFALTPNLYPQSPWVMEYCIAYAVALLPEFTVIARLCLRDAFEAPDLALRLGLSLVAAGTGAAAFYMISKTVVAVSARAPVDFSFGRGFMMSRALPTTAHLLVLVGVAVPAIAEWLRRYRRYRQLGPLWSALYQAEPAIALEPPGLLHGNTLFPTRLQLYRRVIEIRDGLLAIRPYLPSDESTVSGMEDARREAARIAIALRAREKGSPLRSIKIAAVGGHDLGSDTDYLCRLADAYRNTVRTGRRRRRTKR
ncbi:MAB_1171c family putative transporter [Streptomyces sp. NBC_01716]|uniref:MAB_1171c family putative transporter n=1 Tax=Streptomyces sp. NBC_01716 TaxID=2975917 RepID=UPI002E320D93|nr:MAB_1171c family putative transporter [Streptomyces sp. NBC_01716]